MSHNPFIGIPKCQDCGWKLHTDITDNCSCMGPMSPERDLKHKVAYNRAREIQAMSDNNLPTPEPEVIKLFPDKVPDPVTDSVTNDGLVHDDPSVDLEKPEDAVKYYLDGQGIPVNTGAVAPLTQVASEGVIPEPAALTPGGDAPQFIDVGTLPWSKLPIAELSPQTWFAYEKTEVGCCVFDGNGRKLFYTEDEEIAAFAVKAMNLYVAAAMQTQTEV